VSHGASWCTVCLVLHKVGSFLTILLSIFLLLIELGKFPILQWEISPWCYVWLTARLTCRYVIDMERELWAKR